MNLLSRFLKENFNSTYLWASWLHLSCIMSAHFYCIGLFFVWEHHGCCDFQPEIEKTTVGVPSKFQMSINLEASMWYASIKVHVRLMLFPASWHSMTIWNCRCFLFPWLTSQVERNMHCEERILSKKKNPSNIHIAFSSVCLQSYWGTETTENLDWGTAETC